MDTHVPTIKGYAQTIGIATETLYRKWVSARHRLWKFDAWTVDRAIVDRMVPDGVVELEHLNDDGSLNEVLHLTVAEVRRQGHIVNHGWGDQYAVPRGDWRRHDQ